MSTTTAVTTQRLALSVVICAYTLDRWPQLQDAVTSVRDQLRPVDEIIVVIDHNDDLLRRAAQLAAPGLAPQVRVVASAGQRGLSGARNTGVAMAGSPIVAFLDDDARADATWSDRLLGPYADPRVVACGGAAEPVLHGPRPGWWPREFDWVVGCSYIGLPHDRAQVRNLIGANMSARRSAMVSVGGFGEGIGRVGARPLGCEETDLFIRMTQRWPEARIVYEPEARVHHAVPAARLSWSYFRSRCFAEGLSKAQVAARVGRVDALASERRYVLRVLPLGVGRGVADAWRGDGKALRRSLAITAGLALTTAGYAAGRIQDAIRSPFSTRKAVGA
ncbi:MAG TPA: glycosyltransferase family 2 protein [Acidimicrobiales bacterium]|jgi:GT2 family glycosyltransferase|nr:glycosyltransferase family 2 protein [Acidimicrobiales bacterium]